MASANPTHLSIWVGVEADGKSDPAFRVFEKGVDSYLRRKLAKDQQCRRPFSSPYLGWEGARLFEAKSDCPKTCRNPFSNSPRVESDDEWYD